MPVIDQAITSDYALYNSDCLEVLQNMKAESIDISIYSPPFPELYQYSDNPRDVSNCVSYDETIDHYRYVVKEISRLTKPGRLSCVHCCDLKRGIIYQHDFPGDIVKVHEEAGLHYFCRVAIWKDPWEFAPDPDEDAHAQDDCAGCVNVADRSRRLRANLPQARDKRGPDHSHARFQALCWRQSDPVRAQRIRDLPGGPAEKLALPLDLSAVCLTDLDGHPPRAAHAVRR